MDTIMLLFAFAFFASSRGQCHRVCLSVRVSTAERMQCTSLVIHFREGSSYLFSPPSVGLVL